MPVWCGGGEPRRLTNLHAGLFASIDLGSLEEIRFKSSFDQRAVQGWVLKPPGFDASKKHPLLLEIHGERYGGAAAAALGFPETGL